MTAVRPPADGDELREALLRACESAWPETAQVDALLPVVHAYARRVAARELRNAADVIDRSDTGALTGLAAASGMRLRAAALAAADDRKEGRTDG